MYDVIVYVRKVLWEEIKKHMVGVSSQICLRASLVKSGCFTDLETLQLQKGIKARLTHLNLESTILTIRSIHLPCSLLCRWKFPHN